MGEFRVPFQAADSEFVEKRSRFISHLLPVESEEDARAFIAQIKKQYYDARHNCWCYLIGENVVRYSDDGDILTQYIGDGSAVYPVVGLPQLDKESLLTIFDVPEKDRGNYFVKTLGVPAGISFEDTDETERHVEREGISIIYSGRTLKPIRTTRGLVFIESRYLSPVADVLDVLELYERRTAEGTPYIVAKAGFLLQAVIMPYDVINQQFVESLQDLTRECEFSLSENQRGCNHGEYYGDSAHCGSAAFVAVLFDVFQNFLSRFFSFQKRQQQKQKRNAQQKSY